MNPRVSETAAEAPRPVAPIGIDALVAGALLLAGAIVFLWYAPASYQIYLTLHVLAVVVWVGGDITLTTLGIVFEGKRDGRRWPRSAGWARGSARASTPLRCSSSSASGSRWSRSRASGWNHFWIDLRVVGWALAMMIGIAFVGPELGRIDRAAQQLGPGVARGRRAGSSGCSRSSASTRRSSILVVIDMTAKPSF